LFANVRLSVIRPLPAIIASSPACSRLLPWSGHGEAIAEAQGWKAGETFEEALAALQREIAQP
jgi:hypothetical protein